MTNIDGKALGDLVERIEKATGPDRELDAEIMFDVFATPVGKHKDDDGPIGYIRLDDQPSWNLGMRFPGKDRAWFAATRKQIKGETLLIERDGAFVLMNSLRVPDLTGSLDAAVALAERVLPGWYWMKPTLYSMSVFRFGIGDEEDVEISADAATLPLSLCAATLRAYSAVQETAE